MSPALRSLLAALAALAFGAATAQGPAPEPAGRKVLHLAFRSAESSLRPGQGQRPVLAHRHAAHLRGALPVRPPGAADQGQAAGGRGHARGVPDYRTWTVKVRPGIYFGDDPAFKGARRELVAQDFVYPFQRIADPANKSPL
jgi:ABC-type transport system substrate-binding protein